MSEDKKEQKGEEDNSKPSEKKVNRLSMTPERWKLKRFIRKDNASDWGNKD